MDADQESSSIPPTPVPTFASHSAHSQGIVPTKYLKFARFSISAPALPLPSLLLLLCLSATLSLQASSISDADFCAMAPPSWWVFSLLFLSFSNEVCSLLPEPSSLDENLTKSLSYLKPSFTKPRGLGRGLARATVRIRTSFLSSMSASHLISVFQAHQPLTAVAPLISVLPKGSLFRFLPCLFGFRASLPPLPSDESYSFQAFTLLTSWKQVPMISINQMIFLQ